MTQEHKKKKWNVIINPAAILENINKINKALARLRKR